MTTTTPQTTVTLSNDFHKSSVSIRVDADKLRNPGTGVYLSASQYAKVRRELCGIRGCTCGTIRGPQATDDGRSLDIEQDRLGTSQDDRMTYRLTAIDLRGL